MSLMTMQRVDEFEGPGGEIIQAEVVTSDALSALTRAEIDSQIATARRFPRSIKKFMDDARTLACYNEEVARSCGYALPRGKNKDDTPNIIMGPSVRLAEIVAHTFGNLRVACRISQESQRFIVAQTTAIDLEKNNGVQIEVRRSIWGKYGRYNDDMVNMTANAAMSISYRNGVWKVVPAVFYMPVYREARRLGAGGGKSIEERRKNVKAWIESIGVKESELFEFLAVRGWDDVGIEQMEILAGIMTSLKDGETTVEETFRPHRFALEDDATPAAPQAPKADRLAEALERKAAGRGKDKAIPAPPDDAWPAGRE